jgi:hypothetical protein
MTDSSTIAESRLRVRRATVDSQAATNLKGSQRLGSYLHRLRTGYGYSLRRVEVLPLL